jgi:peptide-methionine (S)-S-oxide reductase
MFTECGELAFVGAPYHDAVDRQVLGTERHVAGFDRELQVLDRVERPGVVNTRVGYTGGDVPNATYRNHGSHAEAIEIEFDPTRVSYRDLLEVFFQIHDPTTLNRQGNDVGTSYRSEIFHVSEAQREEALRTIDDVNASGLWPGRTVTKVSPVAEFWEAEPEHQDYLERYPHGYTCHFVRPGWKLPRRAAAGT